MSTVHGRKLPARKPLRTDTSSTTRLARSPRKENQRLTMYNCTRAGNRLESGTAENILFERKGSTRKENGQDTESEYGEKWNWRTGRSNQSNDFGATTVDT